MPLYRLSELLSFLSSLNVHPKKKLSQNFLVDGNILQKILKTAEIKEGDFVLEIGSGPGALTEALLNEKCEVIAVEKDPIFAESLKRFSNLTVYSGDILEFPLESLKKKGKVVSNLPYHLTSPILGILAPRRDLFESITVMVQEEVARRIIAKPNTRDYGSFTIFLNFYCDAQYAFQVSRHCFYPKPAVDSAVVKLLLKEPPKVDENRFFSFVREAFQQRRKMLTTSLKKYKTIAVALEKMQKNPKSRPEELSLEDFLTLFDLSQEKK